MRRIPGLKLWIGHAGDGRDMQALATHGIRAVVQLALEEPLIPLPMARDCCYLRVPLVDSAGNSAALLTLAVETVALLIKQNVATLVCCGAGMSRSPCVVAAALAVVRHVPPAACLEAILRDGPGDVSPGLWGSILELSGLRQR